MGYNRFQYWVKGPRLKKLHKLQPIEKKIEHGDFDWPKDVEKDYLNQKRDLERRVNEFVESRKGLNEEDTRMEVINRFKKGRVTLIKVQEEMYQEEERRLMALKEELENLYRGKHDKNRLWDQALESALKEDCKDTMDFYLLYKEMYNELRQGKDME